MGADDGTLTATGQLALTLDTDAKAGLPFSYTLEGDVEDVSRQHIANRTSLARASGAVVHRRQAAAATSPSRSDGLKTELVAVGLDGAPVPDVHDRRHADADPVDTACAAPRATASTPGRPSARKCRRASGT